MVASRQRDAETQTEENIIENSDTRNLGLNYEGNHSLPSSSQSARKSTRVTSFPHNVNDFIVGGKIKYGIEKVVNYLCLNVENFSFVSSLNKSVAPKNFQEACSDNNCCKRL